MLGIFGFVRSAQNWSTRTPLSDILASPAGIVAFILVTASTIAMVWLINFLPRLTVDKLDDKIENYRKGQEGEERVVDAMRHNLDGDWTLFRNVVLPGRKGGDIDAVLVGPPGVWALEIKNWTGRYRNVGERWSVQTKNGWKPLKKSPSLQANDNAARLGNFFKADGIRQWVTPTVIWANPESTITVENPMVSVWTIDHLPEELGNVWQDRRMDEVNQVQIAEKLTAWCQNNEEEL